MLKHKKSIKDWFKNRIRRPYYWVKLSLKNIYIIFFVKSPKNYFTDIPIIINNFNQYDYLLQLLKSLTDRGYENIIILDNSSSYPPLLDFYEKTKFRVIKLGKNYGHLALWKSGIYKKFQNKYFVYTDPDVVIDDMCPCDFMEHFFRVMKKYKLSSKVGFSLRIDNLPNCFDHKLKVESWETQFWTKQIEKGLYAAPIDTTFALYRPLTKYGANCYENHIRVGFPYSLRHLPWYIDSRNLTENMKYYIQSCNRSTHWTAEMQK